MARTPREDLGSGKKSDRRSAARTIQLLEVARRFYIDTESKVVIAKRLGISRFTVSRLLEQARSSGLVRIDIRPPADVDFALSSALMQKTSLKRAIVLPSADPASELGLLADAAALVSRRGRGFRGCPRPGGGSNDQPDPRPDRGTDGPGDRAIVRCQQGIVFRARSRRDDPRDGDAFPAARPSPYTHHSSSTTRRSSLPCASRSASPIASPSFPS